MRPNVYQYQDPIKQTTYFRGYVKTYQGATCTHVTCPEVRKSRDEAMQDAKKLCTTIRKESGMMVG